MYEKFTWGSQIAVHRPNVAHQSFMFGPYAVFRVACRSSHYSFDYDVCTTAQGPFAAGRKPSGKQCITNHLITPVLCSQLQMADSNVIIAMAFEFYST